MRYDVGGATGGHCNDDLDRSHRLRGNTVPGTGAVIGSTLSDQAAASNEGIKTDGGAGTSGLNMIAARLSPGAISDDRALYHLSAP
jgi:hypothetical protein